MLLPPRALVLSRSRPACGTDVGVLAGLRAPRSPTGREMTWPSTLAPSTKPLLADRPLHVGSRLTAIWQRLASHTSSFPTSGRRDLPATGGVEEDITTWARCYTYLIWHAKRSALEPGHRRSARTAAQTGASALA